jgi:hypothetical protein
MTLQEIGIKHGCDKATKHSYLTHYYNTLIPTDRPVNLLEIGVYKGASMRMWREYLHPDSVIVGVDKDLSQAGECPGCTLIEGDAYAYHFMRHPLAHLPSFDFIIDDGSHTLKNQDDFIILYESYGEVLIIEDVQSLENAIALRDEFENPVIHDLRHVKGRYDDIIVEVRP